jgi:hypothetical protein
MPAKPWMNLQVTDELNQAAKQRKIVRNISVEPLPTVH